MSHVNRPASQSKCIPLLSGGGLQNFGAFFRFKDRRNGSRFSVLIRLEENPARRQPWRDIVP